MSIEITKNIVLANIKVNPYQARVNFDELKIQELANSILQSGLHYPITTVFYDNSYILIDGERRLRAFKYLYENVSKDYSRIPCLVKDLSSEDDIEDFLIINSLITNEQRENLSILERSIFYAKLVGKGKRYKTNREFAKLISKNESDISKMIKIAKASFHPRIFEISKNSKGNIKIFENLMKLKDHNKQLRLYEGYINGEISMKDLIEECKGKANHSVPSFIPNVYKDLYLNLSKENKKSLKKEVDLFIKDYLEKFC